MAQCVTFDTIYAYQSNTPDMLTGFVVPKLESSDTPETCSLVIMSGAEYSQTINPNIDYAQLGVTPEAILFVTSWGIGVVLLMWSFGFAIGSSNTVIKKA